MRAADSDGVPVPKILINSVSGDVMALTATGLMPPAEKQFSYRAS
jgi:hypothetical protein